MKNQEEFVESVIQSMQDIIVKHGLELMQHYPNDLLVHDKANLMLMATPGAQIAWVVGNMHTHIVNLGLSRQENEAVGYLTNLSSSDQFYLINISSGYRANFTKLSRDEFENLALTPVSYSMSCGDYSDFWLMRSDTQIGRISVDVTGNYQERFFHGKVKPLEGITELDKVALQHWVNQAIIKISGTLFVRSDTVWEEVIPSRQAA
jgi:hypothetical protein